MRTTESQQNENQHQNNQRGYYLQNQVRLQSSRIRQINQVIIATRKNPEANETRIRRVIRIINRNQNAVVTRAQNRRVRKIKEPASNYDWITPKAGVRPSAVYVNVVSSSSVNVQRRVSVIY
jgi:predicted DNA-binding ArsR family transcriptional regulator